ncbi:MAG: type I methionyl aminopeptidase [Peptostreptococcales bacterium]
MITIKSNREILLMEKAGKAVAEVLEIVGNMIAPGMTTLDIDKIVEEEIRKRNMIPAFKGYNGFPGSACVSINEEVVHGIPSDKKVICDKDIVSVDIGTIYKGYYGDAARTFPVGNVSKEAERLIEITKDSFYEGLKYCKVGYRLSDISHAIQKYIEDNKCFVVKDFVGHGIGKNMHEEPQIPNYGDPGRGIRLAAGMVFAIEPMVNLGTEDVEVLLDNWTVVTADGSLSAHYEHTVVLTEDEPIILTRI